MASARGLVALALFTAAVSAFDDEVKSLPDAGPLMSPLYAGYTSVSKDMKDARNQLFYFFVRAEEYSDSTPTMIWLNGGPGASSLMGMFVEHLGPYDILPNGSLAVNPHRFSKRYNVLAIDNPVGAGFSYTDNGAYVKNEAEMRAQFVQGLRNFFALHPELLKHPLWVTGESYAGKYIPNIVYELDAAIAADKASGGSFAHLQLKGMIIGNGLYNETAAYTTVAEYAYTQGVIDETTLATVEANQKECEKRIQENDPVAGDFCENVTVRYIYWNVSKIPMYYDLGLEDIDLDSISTAMGTYLARDEVKAALHTTGHTWVNQDEVGPVAEALRSDFTIPSMPVVAKVAEKGYRVALYNGVRDGSVCNHIGQVKALLAMDQTWKFKGQFTASPNVPMMFNAPNGKPYVMAFHRIVENFSFTKILRTGHLVPTVVPDQFHAYVAWAMGMPEKSVDMFII